MMLFVRNYNRTRLKCLDYKAPIEAVTNLAEHNTFAGAGFGTRLRHDSGRCLARAEDALRFFVLR